LVVTTGVVSAAAIANGAVGYIHEFVAVPRAILIPLLVLTLGIAAAWGISESVTIAALFTLIEIGGLFLVVWAARGSFGELPAWSAGVAPAFAAGGGAGVVAGAYLAFYAFLGFEDMVNVAEEIKDVERNLPTAILVTLGATALIYFLVATAAVLTVPAGELAEAGAPLALVFERGSGAAPAVISFIAIFAVLNGALIQIIMAARVLYGLGAERHLPGFFARIHPFTRTPILATALASGAVLALALWFPIEILAETTSVIMLAIFTLVNLALIRVKRRKPAARGARIFPAWIPWAGFLVSAAFLAIELLRRLPL
jgi:amino acid transporter